MKWSRLRLDHRLEAILLPVSLTGVVLLAKTLSPAIEASVEAAGLPTTFIGVVIAALVLLPEGFAAVISARANRSKPASTWRSDRPSPA